MQALISALQALINTPDLQPRQPRTLGAATTTAAAPTLTVIIDVTATPTPTLLGPESTSSAQSPDFAIVVFVFIGILVLVAFGWGGYRCATRKSRNAAREAESSSALPSAPGNELQELAQAEVYGYYAPVARMTRGTATGIGIGINGGSTEQERAAIRQVVYSFFAPKAAPAVASAGPKTEDDGLVVGGPRAEGDA